VARPPPWLTWRAVVGCGAWSTSLAAAAAAAAVADTIDDRMYVTASIPVFINSLYRLDPSVRSSLRPKLHLHPSPADLSRTTSRAERCATNPRRLEVEVVDRGPVYTHGHGFRIGLAQVTRHLQIPPPLLTDGPTLLRYFNVIYCMHPLAAGLFMLLYVTGISVPTFVIPTYSFDVLIFDVYTYPTLYSRGSKHAVISGDDSYGAVCVDTVEYYMHIRGAFNSSVVSRLSVQYFTLRLLCLALYRLIDATLQALCFRGSQLWRRENGAEQRVDVFLKLR